jgi:hypothetical protein
MQLIEIGKINNRIPTKHALAAAMKFTAHGKHRAKERGITEESIMQSIREPSSLFFDLSSAAYVAFKKLNGQQLLVVYTSEGNEVKVITTFITSSAQEIIHSKLKANVWVRIK